MAIPPQLLLAAARMLKNRKSPTAQIKEALAPATDALKNDIAPLVGMGADAGMMYNLREEDPSMRTGIATGAIGSAARGFQANGIKGLITGGIMGGLTGAIATGNAKEQKAEQDKYTYLNQMYSSVVGADTDLQSALMYAEDGGEIVSAEGETFVPIQTEAKKIGKKLVKEKFIFSDGKIADVNATKPHSEQKKDAVTDITVEGTYVMPVSTKLSKKDLDSLISYSTSNYSENGKNFAVEKVTLRDILGEKFEGSFAEATDIVVKKYPVMDTDDDLDPIARITNNENIANRSKIIAHLMRLNEAKINKEPIEEVKLTPSMKAKSGGYIQKYVLGSTVAGDPPKKRKMNINEFPFLEKVGMTPAESTARAFHEDSLNSEGYKKRIKKSAPSGYTAAEKEQYAKDVINDRRLNLRATKNKGLGVSAPTNIGEYRGWDESIGFNESGLNDTQVNTHELSHATTMGMENFLYDDAMRMDKKINTYENRDKKGETRRTSPQHYDYLRTPTEVKARLDVLKQYAAKKGIVKIGEDITPAKMDDLINKIYNDESIEVEEVYNHYEDLLQILKEDKKNSKQDTLGKLWNEIADSNGKMKPLIVAKKGGFVSKYVLKPKMALKKGGYIRKMAVGGGVGDPPGKKYKSANGTMIVGDDGKYYFGKKDGSYIEANKQTADLFNSQLMSSKNPSGGENQWLLVEDTKKESITSENNNNQKRPNINIDQLPMSSLDPLNSMNNMDILGTPINRTNTSINSNVTESETNKTTGIKWGGDYLVQKANNWEQNTPNIQDVNTTKSNTYTTTSPGTKNEKWKDEALTKRWQQRLKDEGLYQNGEVDGAWGPKTQAAYEAYQKRKDGNSSVNNSDNTTSYDNENISVGKDNNYGYNSEVVDYFRKNNIDPTGENVDAYYNGTFKKPNATPYSLIKNRPLIYSKTQGSRSRQRNKSYQEDVTNRLNSLYSSDKFKNASKFEQLGLITEVDPLSVFQEGLVTGISSGPISRAFSALEKGNKSRYVLKPAEVVVKGKGSRNIKGWDSFFKKKGGYIRKMSDGGPIVPIIPEPWRDIWAIDETGQQPYYPMPNMVNNPLYDMSPIGKISNALPSDNNPYQVGVPIGTPRDDNPYEIGKQIGTPRADSKTSTPNTGDEEVLDMYRTKISERKGDAVRDAEEAKTGYKALSKRVGMRDLMQLGKGLVGIGLQDRTERRAFKRPLYIDQKYRGLSPQQINQQAEAGTGAGVEAIKQMMNGGGDRVTARLAPILIDRLIQQQGQTRKAYVDQNTSLERAKYAERGTIQQFNLDEEARAKNEERDFNNKAISSSAQLINKYISSRSAGDIEGYKTEEGINRDLTDKLYKLDNQGMEVDMIDKEYEMQMSDVRQKIAEMEAELMNPNITFDEAARKSKEWYIARGKEDLKNLEERQKKSKIRQNINGN